MKATAGAQASGSGGSASGRRGAGLPGWLDGATVAIIGTVLTVAVAIGGLMLVSTSAIRTEINGLRGEMVAMRKELIDRIDVIDARLRVVEQTVLTIQLRVTGLEARVREVEAHTRQPLETAHAGLSQPDG